LISHYEANVLVQKNKLPEDQQMFIFHSLLHYSLATADKSSYSFIPQVYYHKLDRWTSLLLVIP